VAVGRGYTSLVRYERRSLICYLMDARVGVPAQYKLYAFSYRTQDPKMALEGSPFGGTAISR